MQRTAVAHDFSLEGQHVRRLGHAALQVRVAALAQDVQRENDALAGVDPVFLDGADVGPILHATFSRVIGAQ